MNEIPQHNCPSMWIAGEPKAAPDTSKYVRCSLDWDCNGKIDGKPCGHHGPHVFNDDCDCRCSRGSECIPSTPPAPDTSTAAVRDDLQRPEVHDRLNDGSAEYPISGCHPVVEMIGGLGCGNILHFHSPACAHVQSAISGKHGPCNCPTRHIAAALKRAEEAEDELRALRKTEHYQLSETKRELLAAQRRIDVEVTRQIEQRKVSDSRIAELEGALREIACFDDVRADEVLQRTGSYGSFDEPGSVQVARQALRRGEK